MSWNKDPIYKKRRTAVAFAGLGTLAAIGVGIKELPGAVDHAVHVNKEVAFYSQEDLASRYKEADPKKRLIPTDVTFGHVEATDMLPTDAARRMGAIDVMTVGTEIGAQLGGDRLMRAGDEFVIPNDQLKGSD